MSLQESLVADFAARFPGPGAGPLVQELLARIRNGAGGATGFINELRAQGLSDTVAGWLRQDTRREPTLDQAERALGSDFIERAAKLTDASVETTGRQLAYLLPKAVSGTAAEETRELYGNMPSRAVAWTIFIVLLAALAGLYWFVAGDNAGVPRRPALAGELSTVVTPKPKPAVAKPASPVPVEPPVARIEQPPAVKDVATPPVKPPVTVPANGQRGNRYAVAALEALKSGSAGGEITAALNLSVINFSSNSAVLPKDSAEMLKRAAAVLKTAAPGTRIEIGGHTDNIGDAAYNVYLSDKRAKAVREELIRQGAKAESLSAKGYGGARPVVSNDTREGRARNRRIEFTVQN
jgi:outer membrane protein OmpA-like peptidoglycan-associated protein